MTAPQKEKRRRRRKGGPARASRFHRRSVSVPDGHLIVGRILGAHGLRGEVKVESYTDFEDRFNAGQQLLLGDELQVTEISTSRAHKGIFLLGFNEIRDRPAADLLHNEWLYIPEEAAMQLDEDSFWVHDIIGLNVQTESQERLGEVVDVLFTGANEVYIVRPIPGINQDRELLIPALAEVIRSVDLEAGAVTVRLLPGMLDETGH
jgi:16S rRNA processing protein RimM